MSVFLKKVYICEVISKEQIHLDNRYFAESGFTNVMNYAKEFESIDSIEQAIIRLEYDSTKHLVFVPILAFKTREQ